MTTSTLSTKADCALSFFVSQAARNGRTQIKTEDPIFMTSYSGYISFIRHVMTDRPSGAYRLRRPQNGVPINPIVAIQLGK
jgi:hypothetical protein